MSSGELEDRPRIRQRGCHRPDPSRPPRSTPATDSTTTGWLTRRSRGARSPCGAI